MKAKCVPYPRASILLWLSGVATTFYYQHLCYINGKIACHLRTIDCLSCCAGKKSHKVDKEKAKKSHNLKPSEKLSYHRNSEIFLDNAML